MARMLDAAEEARTEGAEALIDQEALGELVSGSEGEEEAPPAAQGAAEEGAPAPEGAPEAAGRRRLTARERLELFRRLNASVERARLRARRALSRQRADAFSVVMEVTLRDQAVQDAFLRSFVAVDACAARLEGEVELSLIGRKKREALAGQLESMARAFRDEQARYLEAARELSARLLAGVESEALVLPVVEAPFKERVYVHSPIALLVVRALADADAIVAELETLRWNGLRRASEVNEERRRIQREAARIGKFAFRTSLLLDQARRRLARQAGDPRPEPAGGA